MRSTVCSVVSEGRTHTYRIHSSRDPGTNAGSMALDPRAARMDDCWILIRILVGL